MDARQRRTSLKLAEVILRLANDRRPSELTVSEVTSAAGINRSTFYQHAVSPTDLLENVLRAELDDIRTRYLPSSAGGTGPTMLGDVTVAVLEHINSHATIYSRGLDGSSGSASLYPLLSQHFRQSVQQLLDHHTVELPLAAIASTPTAEGPDGGQSAVSEEFVAEAAARVIADGTVGAIDVWLHTPEPRSVDQFTAVYRLIMPSWWPLG